MTGRSSLWKDWLEHALSPRHSTRSSILNFCCSAVAGNLRRYFDIPFFLVFHRLSGKVFPAVSRREWSWRLLTRWESVRYFKSIINDRVRNSVQCNNVNAIHDYYCVKFSCETKRSLGQGCFFQIMTIRDENNHPGARGNSCWHHWTKTPACLRWKWGWAGFDALDLWLKTGFDSLHGLYDIDHTDIDHTRHWSHCV